MLILRVHYWTEGRLCTRKLAGQGRLMPDLSPPASGNVKIRAAVCVSQQLYTDVCALGTRA